MKNCASCGTDNEDSAVFCESCGKPLDIRQGLGPRVPAVAPSPVNATPAPPSTYGYPPQVAGPGAPVMAPSPINAAPAQPNSYGYSWTGPVRREVYFKRPYGYRHGKRMTASVILAIGFVLCAVALGTAWWTITTDAGQNSLTLLDREPCPVA
jgi:hypothetical protein